MRWRARRKRCNAARDGERALACTATPAPSVLRAAAMSTAQSSEIMSTGGLPPSAASKSGRRSAESRWRSRYLRGARVRVGRSVGARSGPSRRSARGVIILARLGGGGGGGVEGPHSPFTVRFRSLTRTPRCRDDDDAALSSSSLDAPPSSFPRLNSPRGVPHCARALRACAHARHGDRRRAESAMTNRGRPRHHHCPPNVRTSHRPIVLRKRRGTYDEPPFAK